MSLRSLVVSLLLALPLGLYAQRSEVLLEKGWSFIRGDHPGAQNKDFDDYG